ncbi:hypothetical protein EI94DRAFT_347100 [Lactarius quietus]|nr:hypothetical protein EI94DRAFT_347100 [Lactarius quietus]
MGALTTMRRRRFALGLALARYKVHSSKDKTKYGHEYTSHVPYSTSHRYLTRIFNIEPNMSLWCQWSLLLACDRTTLMKGCPCGVDSVQYKLKVNQKKKGQGTLPASFPTATNLMISGKLSLTRYGALSDRNTRLQKGTYRAFVGAVHAWSPWSPKFLSLLTRQHPSTPDFTPFSLLPLTMIYSPIADPTAIPRATRVSDLTGWRCAPRLD